MSPGYGAKTNTRTDHGPTADLSVALRGGCCINPLQRGPVGGRHSNVARGCLPSHFASAMGALVWRSPTASELCNSHRERRQFWSSARLLRGLAGYVSRGAVTGPPRVRVAS
jgi:hypothetical protein